MKRSAGMLVLMLIMVSIVAVPAATQGSGQNKLITYFNTLPQQTLDAGEIAGLRHMLQEEKLARDVYKALDYFWNLPVFGNIAQSEQQHMDFVRLIYTRYNLKDPIPSDQIGVYADIQFTHLFQLLVIIGSQSVQNALWIGTAIEDLDLADLAKEISATDNRDIQMIYQNLAKGSRNHLRAFYPNLLTWNGAYTPIFLTPTVFNQILNSKHEGGVVYDENGVPLP